MAERPNPVSIGVCALIALHSDPKSPLHDLQVPRRLVCRFLEETVLFGAGSSIAQTALHHPDNHDDASISQWVINLREKLGNGVADTVLETLSMASESVDALVDFFDSLGATIQLGVVDASSVHGTYIRKVRLGFDELSFEAVIILWRALKERVEVISHSNQVHDVDKNTDTFTVNLSHNSSEWIWPLSTDQLQDMLRQDCLDFELDQESNHPQNGISNKSHGARKSFEEMEVYIRQLLHKDPTLPAAYFLRYLNCLRHGERVGALDALHQYFDHALVHQSSGNATTDILQFSAILLAMTHSSFGDSNLALMATEEAVRVAQQSKDASCVAFALGWLFEHVGRGTGDRRELLQRCASGAQQLQLRSLVAGAQMSLAKSIMEANGNHKGNSFARGIHRSAPSLSSSVEGFSMWQTAWSHLQEVTAEPATDQRVYDRPTHLYNDVNDSVRGKARQHLVSAGIWNEIGMPDMAQTATATALQSAESLSYDDRITAIQNLSRVVLYGTYVGNGNQKGATAEDSCVYAKSIETVLQLRNELGLENKNLEGALIQSVALTLHEWAVNSGELDDARALQIALDSYLHPGLVNYDQLYYDIAMQKCLYFCRTENYEKAKFVSRDLLVFCKRCGPLSNQIRVLLQLASMHLESDPHQCTAAFSPLLEALALAEQWEMHGLHAAGISLLAKVFLRLQNPSRSIAILTGILPTLTQKEHVRFQAEAYLTLCKAHLKLAATQTLERRKQGHHELTYELKQRYTKALNALNHSLKLFRGCQDKIRCHECLLLQSRLYLLLGCTKKGEDATEQLRMVSARVVAPCKPILNSLNDPVALLSVARRNVGY